MRRALCWTALVILLPPVFALWAVLEFGALMMKAGLLCLDRLWFSVLEG